MAKAHILLTDNDRDFLDTRADFLRQEGYWVTTASSPAEAKRKLEQEDVDLAIVDIRLLNDDDEKDVSGLMLAQEIAPSVPKIILTGFPSYQSVREALRIQPDGLPSALDFVAKEEGPEAMIAAVSRVLSLSSTVPLDVLLSPERDKRLGRVTLNISVQWEKDLEAVRKEAIWTNRLRLLMITIGTVVMFVGAISALIGQTSVGIVSAITGVIAQGLGVLFSKFAEDANKRRDRYHKDLRWWYERTQR